MESFQLQRLLVYPRAAFLHRHGIVQLRVEGQHVQLHLFAIDHLYGVHHILYELGVRRTGWMYPHHHLRLRGLLLVGTLRLHQVAVGVDGLLALLVGLHDGSRQLLEQTCGKRLSAGRVADNQGRVVQPAQLFRAVVESVGTACHQRHHQTASHEHCRRILVALQSFADVADNGKLLCHLLYFLTPDGQLRVKRLVLLSLPLQGEVGGGFPVVFSRHLLDGSLHRLRGRLREVFLLVGSHAFCG